MEFRLKAVSFNQQHFADKGTPEIERVWLDQKGRPMATINGHTYWLNNGKVNDKPLSYWESKAIQATERLRNEIGDLSAVTDLYGTVVTARSVTLGPRTVVDHTGTDIHSPYTAAAHERLRSAIVPPPDIEEVDPGYQHKIFSEVDAQAEKLRRQHAKDLYAYINAVTDPSLATALVREELESDDPLLTAVTERLEDHALDAFSEAVTTAIDRTIRRERSWRAPEIADAIRLQFSEDLITDPHIRELINDHVLNKIPDTVEERLAAFALQPPQTWGQWLRSFWRG